MFNPKKYSIFLFCCIFFFISKAQDSNQVIYIETEVPEYDLPQILTNEKGNLINSIKKWEEQRRPKILSHFRKEVYGQTPSETVTMKINSIKSRENILGGLVDSKQVSIVLSQNDKSIDIEVLIYIPAKTSQPVPAFLGLNFMGNQSIYPDKGIKITDEWVRNNSEAGIENNSASEKTRGVSTGRWPVEYIIESGYGLITAYYGDIDPDFDDRFQNGAHSLYLSEKSEEPDSSEWGSIGAWAWGLSRIMDYLEQESAIDTGRVALFGHSRLGKAALWGGAQDERFDIIISNCSGCGGAAISRRRFGERIKNINDVFPHWFCDNFKKYNDREDKLPIDQHMLIGTIAPRPVYIASASQDKWADPKGEFLSAKLGSKVYEKIYNREGLSNREMPKINSPLNTDYVGYHIRPGQHNITLYDWERYIDFVEPHFKTK